MIVDVNFLLEMLQNLGDQHTHLCNIFPPVDDYESGTDHGYAVALEEVIRMIMIIKKENTDNEFLSTS